MEQTKIEKAALKAKSEEMGIPFSAMLSGYVSEVFRYLLSESEFADFLWIKNPQIYEKEQWGSGSAHLMEFTYLADQAAKKSAKPVPGQKLSVMMGYVMIASILKKEKVPEIKWKGRAAMKDNVLELVLTGEFEEMTVPLTVQVTQMEQTDIVPKKRTAARLFGDTEFTYLEYPYENILAENLILILKNMELIPDMGAYEAVFHILKQEPVNGRHIREMLTDACGQGAIEPKEERVAEILSYRDYPYMKKRWEKYLRKQKKTTPQWEEIMDILEVFLTDIWNSICRDEVFFGDWMPDLGRFLD